MVYFMENPIKMDDFGGTPVFGNTPVWFVETFRFVLGGGGQGSWGYGG